MSMKLTPQPRAHGRRSIPADEPGKGLQKGFQCRAIRSDGNLQSATSSATCILHSVKMQMLITRTKGAVPPGSA